MKVVSLYLHGCPVSFLGAYGNEWVATPTLDRLAAEGVVFDAHFAAEPGRLPGPLPGPLPGRSVFVRSTRPTNDSPAGYYAGWGEVVDARPDAKDGSPLDSFVRTLPGILDALLVSSNSDWHLGIELDSLLPPWHVPQDVFDVYVEELVEDGEAVGVEPWTDPPTGWFDTDDEASWELLHRTFAAAMTVFDVKLGAVFDLLRERGLDRDAAWVFTAGAGFPLGEHGVIGYHRPWLHGELVHLPLIVRYPGGENAGRRVGGFTQPEDLRDVSNLLHVQRDVAITRSTMNGGSEVAIRSAEWTYLHPLTVPVDDEPRQPMLFTRSDDRWEVNDLAARNPEVVEDLANRVQSSAGGSS
jgi:arylsulfatase A-like enzyme